jgi:hypothetical protein
MTIADRSRRIASDGTPLACTSGAEPFRVVRQNVRAGLRAEEPGVVAGPALLHAIRHCQRRVERQRVGAGEDGQGGKLLRRFIGDLPGEAGAPVIFGEAEAAAGLG